MNIEQKAKAYDKAIEKARIWKDKSGMPKDKQGILDDIFPGLKESEDEKTKRLLHTIANKMSQHLRDIFTEEEFQCFDAWSNAWLEKQEQKPADEVEPKFKVGDTMRTLQEAKDGWTDGMPVVVSIDKEYYHCNNELIPIKDQDDYEFPPMNRIQPKSQWKPSDEQMNAFDAVLVYNPPCSDECRNHLITLYNELKKLK